MSCEYAKWQMCPLVSICYRDAPGRSSPSPGWVWLVWHFIEGPAITSERSRRPFSLCVLGATRIASKGFRSSTISPPTGPGVLIFPAGAF